MEEEEGEGEGEEGEGEGKEEGKEEGTGERVVGGTEEGEEGGEEGDRGTTVEVEPLSKCGDYPTVPPWYSSSTFSMNMMYVRCSTPGTSL